MCTSTLSVNTSKTIECTSALIIVEELVVLLNLTNKHASPTTRLLDPTWNTKMPMNHPTRQDKGLTSTSWTVRILECLFDLIDIQLSRSLS